MNKKTVIFFTWSTLWSMKSGSGAPSFQKTIELYMSKGWDVYVIASDKSNGMVDLIDPNKLFILPFKRTDSLIGVPNWTKPFLLRKVKNYNKYAIKMATKIINSLLESDILIYAYEVHGVAAAKRISQEFNLPLVTRFQGTVATYFNNSIFTRIKHKMRLDALKTKADLVIMTDDGSKGLETLKKLGNPSLNIKFWKNGVDPIPDSYEYIDIRHNLHITEDDIVFLTVSRLQNWKHVERAINIFKKVNDSYNNSKLIICGDGDERSNLENLVKSYELSNNVFFIGAVNHNDVYSYLHASDFFMSFYDMSNVGNPLLEAMQAGKCILTLNVGDTCTLIKNNYTGVIVDLEELDNMPSKVIELLNNKDKFEKLSNNAKMFADMNFISWDRRMENEYTEVIKLFERGNNHDEG